MNDKLNKLSEEELSEVNGGGHIRPKNLEDHIGEVLKMSHGMFSSDSCKVRLLKVADNGNKCTLVSMSKSDRDKIWNHMSDFHVISYNVIDTSIQVTIQYGGSTNMVWLEKA